MTPPADRLPNFFLVGAPKAGSTSLNRYLEQHPDIYMSPIKEPHFFADELRIANFSPAMRKLTAGRAPQLREWLDGSRRDPFTSSPIEDWRDYLSLFRAARPAQMAGEASVCYLWSPSASGNIRRAVSDAKILIVLRNPVDRAFSQYLHMLSAVPGRISFREHMDRSLASRSTVISPLYPFLDFGLYTAQLERYFAAFPRRSIYVGFYADFQDDPLTFLQEIFRFLGVDPGFVPDFSRRHMEARVPRSWPVVRILRQLGLGSVANAALTPSVRARLRDVVFRPRRSLVLEAPDRARLAEFYRDDVYRLSALLGRDLTGWVMTPDTVPSDRRSFVGTPSQ